MPARAALRHRSGGAIPRAAASALACLPPGLVYVCDTMPGLRRELTPAGFVYRDSSGRLVRNRETLARIRQLAIPPAYDNVWICALPNGHLQATGRDARGRKQYRYHPAWSDHRGAGKFDRIEAFGRALPRIRARVARDLQEAPRSVVPRTLVLATLVRLLDTTFLRIGNEEYARGNGSYGLTTLQDQHAGVRGSVLRLSFRGKSGKPHDVSIADPRVARVVRRCQQLPGQELFQYQDADGTPRGVGSSDVNDYLHEAAGERFTAKDFRTWHGSVQALDLLLQGGSGDETPKARATAVLAEVSRRLGNTVAVCRKSYIHPCVLDLGLAPGAVPADVAELRERVDQAVRPMPGLRPAEQRLLAFLKLSRRRAQRAGPRIDKRTAGQRRAAAHAALP